jgi:hypothetical protein
MFGVAGVSLTNSVAPETEGSSPNSQQPAICPYPEPTFSQQISLRPILVPSSHLHLGLPRRLFPSGFPTKGLYNFQSSHACHMPHPPLPPWLDLPNDMWGWAQNMKLYDEKQFPDIRDHVLWAQSASGSLSRPKQLFSFINKGKSWTTTRSTDEHLEGYMRQKLNWKLKDHSSQSSVRCSATDKFCQVKLLCGILTCLNNS